MIFLRFLFSFYALLVFFVFAIPILFGYITLKFLPYKKQIGGAYFLNRILVFIVAFFTFFRFKIRGIEKIDLSRNWIVISNHNNLMDMIAAAYGIRINAKPLVKKEVGRIPILGQLFQIACLLVDRSSKTSRENAQNVLKKEIEMGGSILIFPEGTRNRTNKPLKSFYNGAFDLALETGVPILPIVFTNIRKIARPDSLLINPGIIEVNYLNPIFPDNFEKNDVENFKQFCFNEMESFLLKNDDEFKKALQIESND
jgi:1-acyl-sn-glycerol-3-phosphate acyltransferase